MSPGRPLKLTSFTPPHFPPPHPFSQASTSPQVRSFTALWIGTMTAMSASCGLCCLRAIAAKNCACEGYTHFSPSVRGMDDISRSVGRCSGAHLNAALVGDVDAGAGDGRKPVHDDRVLWSTGHFSPPSTELDELDAVWSTGHLDMTSGKNKVENASESQVRQHARTMSGSSQQSFAKSARLKFPRLNKLYRIVILTNYLFVFPRNSP